MNIIANEILSEHFKRVNPEKDFYIFKTMQPEQYDAMIMAMEEYAIEVLKSIPEGTYKHDSLLTNPNTQETFTLKEFIEKA